MVEASTLLYYFNNTLSDDADAQLYSMFHSVGQTPVLIVPAVFLSLIGLFGIPLNAAIVFTTIKHQKTLNRNANYLIALNAFFDMLQLTHPFPFLLIAISGTNFIGSFHSMRLLIPSLFGIQCSLTCMACTGVDRLLSVLMPFHYHRVAMNRGRYLYCAMLTFLCVLNGVWNVAGLWRKSAAEAAKPVTGFIGQIGWDSGKDIVHYLVGPVLICMAIFCYIAIGLILCLQKKLNGWTSTSGINQQQRRLLKSLYIIVVVHVGTLLFGSILLGFVNFSTKMTWYMMNISLCAILLGASANAVVLYLNSSEYRLLFNQSIISLKKTALRTIGIIQAVRIFTISSTITPARIGSNRTVPIG